MGKRILLPTLAIAALMSAMPCSKAVAADDTTSSTEAIYDFSGFNDQNLIKLFYNAYLDGRKYPTAAEFAAAGIQQSDIAFIRSHVRNKGLIDRSGRLIKDTYEKRNLWMNIPMGQGKDGSVGQPTKTFDSDVYSMWNYTNLFGCWNHGFFSAPAVWTDAAHKNGADMMSGIKFFDTTGGRGEGAGDWMDFCTATDDAGNYKYIEPIINCLMYFGFDGINYNWEDSGFYDEDITAFHKGLWKKAAENGFDNFHCGIYTSVSSLSSYYGNSLFGNDEGRTFELMLNYDNGDFSSNISPSAQTAIKQMGTADGLYTGMWFVSMNRSWTKLNADDYSKQVGVCLWGEHASSRIWSYTQGDDAYDRQNNYQYMQERLMSGGNRNPLLRPAISNTGNDWETDASSGKAPLQGFAGLATWIPERSSIFGNLPFATNFNLGNGDRYAYKGKKTAGAWYNMGDQDVVPTYRWLVVKPGTETVSTDIDATFSHEDQYIGGSSLLLKGKATAAGTDVVLYKTELNVSAANPYVKIAVKNGKEGTNASNLYVIVQKGDGSWAETPVGDITGANWEEKKIALAGVAQSDVIKHIGLRVKGSDDAYKMYVGKLEVNDDVKANPALVKDLNVEVKEETKTTMSAKIFWNVDAKGEKRADWDLVYNDEANIDHFEILYKNGENGKVSEIGRTTTWSTYIGDIEFENATDDPYIGVRSVSTDLKTYSPVEWVHVTRGDQSTLPNKKDESYGISQMNPNCDGADIARQQRYVTDVTTTGADQNLDYHTDHPVADGTQYDDQTALTLKVHQGQEVTLKLKCYDTSKLSKTDGLRYCFAGGWIDLNGDHNFNPADIATDPANGERLFFLGKLRAATPEFETEGISCTFTVPEDAKTGKSRLRIVFSDAWFAGDFLPTGLHNKGFSMDFGVEITGNNPERQGPVDIHDQGTADEPEELDGNLTGVTTAKEGVSKVELADGALNFQNVDKAWVYDANGAMVKYLVAPSAFQTTGLASGVYLVKMQYGNVLRSQKVVVK